MVNNSVATYKGIQEYFSESTVGLVNRERELKQLQYAILTKEHLLLTGKAGTGKSQFALKAFENIADAKVFSIHLTKQTTEEYVFGPLDIQEFKKGKIKHNIDDGILKADFAFIDEFFDASDVLLRSLLGVLNERVWLKAGNIKAPLHTAVLTSNYMRENEITEAILDRIIFKAQIGPLTKPLDRVKAYESYLKNSNKTIKQIPLSELQQIAELIDDPKSVEFDKDILKIYDKLASEFQEEFTSGSVGVGTGKKYISQRTLHKALKVVKAKALIDGRKKAEYEDLSELKYVFCTLNVEEEEVIFDAVFEKIVVPVIEDRKLTKDIAEFSQKTGQYPTDYSKVVDAEELVEVCRSLTVLIDGITNLKGRVTSEKLKNQVTTLLKDTEDTQKKAADRLYEITDKEL